MKMKVIKAFTDIWDSMIKTGDDMKTKLGGVFKKLMYYALKPFQKIADTLPDKIFGKSAKDSIKSLMREFAIESPSKVTERIANQVVAGFDRGLSPMSSSFKKPVGAMLKDVDDMHIQATALGKRISDNRAKVVDLQSKIRGALSTGEFGDNGTLTIKRPDNTLVVNLKVTMDADNVERVLVDRPNTRIVTNEFINR